MKSAALEIFAQAGAAQDDARPMPRAVLAFAHPDGEAIAHAVRTARSANRETSSAPALPARPRSGISICRDSVLSNPLAAGRRPARLPEVLYA